MVKDCTQEEVGMAVEFRWGSGRCSCWVPRFLSDLWVWHNVSQHCGTVGLLKKGADCDDHHLIEVKLEADLRTKHIHTNVSPGSKALPLTNIDRDIERKLAPGILGSPHTYDLGLKALPLTYIDWRY